MEAWVGCLGCYNAGSLVGAWVGGTEATDLEPHDYLAVAGISAPACGDVKADERWVFDHSDAAGLISGECSPSVFQRTAELTDKLEAAGYPLAAVSAFLSNTGDDLDDKTGERFTASFYGEYGSGAEYAEEYANSIGAIDARASWPLYYIDWEAAWRELETGGDRWEANAPGGMVYIFGVN